LLLYYLHTVVSVSLSTPMAFESPLEEVG
jgi:hypothetical protein